MASGSPRYRPRARLRRLAAAALGLVLLSGLSVGHALWRRAEDARTLPARRALVRGLGFADLALSSSARWLRHPSQVEPTAPFADLPASWDPDPAGALIGPPEPLEEDAP